jgi:hypothetical protein
VYWRNGVTGDIIFSRNLSLVRFFTGFYEMVTCLGSTVG